MTLAGKTLLERVVLNAQKAAKIAGECDTLVATDDDRIAQHAEKLGVPVTMTDPALDSGSARAFAAAQQQLPAPRGVINLQGDAPFIAPGVIADLIAQLRSGDAPVVTPVYQLSWDRLDQLRDHKRLAAFSGTTCIRDKQGRALWFSKTIVPAIRDEEALRRREPAASAALSPVWQHLGLYAYTMEALSWFTKTAQGPYEKLEGLEQLRFLENGWDIATIAVTPPQHALSGIDTPQDLKLAEAAIARFGEPFES